MRLTTHGARIHGALVTYISPRLARDQKLPDIVGILAGASRVNRVSQRAGIATSVRAVTQSRLAQDADIDDISELLEALERVSKEHDGGGEDEGEAIPMVRGSENDDAAVVSKIRAFCAARLSPQDCEELDELFAQLRERDDKSSDPAADRGARKAAHDALPAGVKSAEQRFANILARPAEFGWIAAPERRRDRPLAIDAAMPSGVAPAETRFPGIAKRIGLGWGR